MANRSHNDNLDVALVLLGTAPTVEVVVAIVRDYVAAQPASQGWLRGELQDADDIAGCAVDLARVRIMDDRSDESRDALEILLARACMRVATLLDQASRARGNADSKDPARRRRRGNSLRG